jgi:ketosteroid isomerase-like protein
MTNRDAEIIAAVRRAFDAFSRGDVDALRKYAHPEIELVTNERQTLKGAARVRAWREPDAFESQVVEPLDFRVVGNKVLVRMRAHIKGAGSGIEVDALGWTVLTYDDAGLLTRVELYLDHEEAEALKAVGLSE